jgi:hypothetical protein
MEAQAVEYSLPLRNQKNQIRKTHKRSSKSGPHRIPNSSSALKCKELEASTAGKLTVANKKLISTWLVSLSLIRKGCSFFKKWWISVQHSGPATI